MARGNGERPEGDGLLRESGGLAHESPETAQEGGGSQHERGGPAPERGGLAHESRGESHHGRGQHDEGQPEAGPSEEGQRGKARRAGSRLVKLEDVKKHPLVHSFIQQADAHLESMGYTEHGYRHCNLVARIAYNLMIRLGYPQRYAELAAIAGYTHDIGNVVNRDQHWITGAVLMVRVLEELGMDPHEIGLIAGAIGNHEESNGHPVNPIAAALILADKTDVHRTRVRGKDVAKFDIHDRVNYSVERSFLNVDKERATVTLELTVDPSITPVLEYFEIFLSRMVLCRRAAQTLSCTFHLTINHIPVL